MRFLCYTLLSIVAHAQVAVTTATDWPDAVSKAKAEGKDIAVLLDGSDWSPIATSFRQQVVGSNAVRMATAKTYVWVTIDSPERETEATKALAEKNKPFGYRPWNLPAVVLADTEGRVYASVAGAEARDSATLLARLATGRNAVDRMRSKLNEAGKHDGTRKANVLGAALAEIDMKFSRDQFKGLVQEIAKLDPTDSTGWRLRYEFDDLSFLEGTVLKLCGEQKISEAIRECDKRLANNRITTEQRQQILAARFAALRRSGKPVEALNTLAQLQSVDPRSELGKGARNLGIFHSQPVKLRGWFWDGWDMRPDFTAMEIDARSKLSLTGDYFVEFKGWGLEVRSVALVVNGKEVSLSESRPRQPLRIRVDAAPRSTDSVVLRIQARGQGWYDGRGTIEVRKAE